MLILFFSHFLISHWNTAIVGLVCHLLAGEGHGTVLTYCPQFFDINQLPCRSHRFHSWDPAEHLYVMLIPAILEYWIDLEEAG